MNENDHGIVHPLTLIKYLLATVITCSVFCDNLFRSRKVLHLHSVLDSYFDFTVF